ncbi:unnamed protein product [Cladocopium goreaui]|uniref:Uncharacterized protein n=1 Tax=Cladocopium goreaui TaxID=2562237 RepID=A0A9P1FKS1_9DINO|nr:unnamed protein product [Cladocopium goreaui]
MVWKADFGCNQALISVEPGGIQPTVRATSAFVRILGLNAASAKSQKYRSFVKAYKDSAFEEIPPARDLETLAGDFQEVQVWELAEALGTWQLDQHGAILTCQWALVLEVFAPWGADGVRAQPGKQAAVESAAGFGRASTVLRGHGGKVDGIANQGASQLGLAATAPKTEELAGSGTEEEESRRPVRTRGTSVRDGRRRRRRRRRRQRRRLLLLLLQGSCGVGGALLCNELAR